jgi:radical SAM superfamily enzyme YgiQ (UPF0313 family)
MKVTLISPYDTIFAYGMRMLAAVLKQAGVRTQMIMLPYSPDKTRSSLTGFGVDYPEDILDQVAELAKDSDLVGISLSSNYFERAVLLTRHLRHSVRAPIIWGGIHATISPEQCLDHADLVCVGEGEEALRELALQMMNGKGWTGVQNIWYKDQGRIVRTPIRPLDEDLDSYPYPAYDLNAEYVLHEGRIQPATKELWVHYLRANTDQVWYGTMWSRGCLYRCTYCCNNALGRLYGKGLCVRRRSVSNFIGELKQITELIPEISRIMIADSIFATDPQSVTEFCGAYGKEIGIPFYVNLHPAHVDEEGVRMLIDAGLKSGEIGVQSGSPRVLREVYHRPCTRQQVVHAFEVLNKFSGRLSVTWQFILDNPWETVEDHLEAIRMLLQFQKPLCLELYSLTFFPGTHLYERAREEGLITDDQREIYRKEDHTLKRTYINGLYKLLNVRLVPHGLIAFLMSAPMRRLNWIWLLELTQSVGRWDRLLTRMGSGTRKLSRGDWSPIRSAARRTWGGVPVADAYK